MCNKCGYTPYSNPQRIQREAAKIALAQQLASGITGFMNCVFNVVDHNSTGGSRSTEEVANTKNINKNANTDEVDNNKEDQQKPSVDSKESVKNLIKGNINVDDSLIDDLVKKYDSIKTINPSITDEQMLDRLRNYVKGKQYRSQETNWKNTIAKLEEEIKKSDVYKNTPDELKEKYLKAQTVKLLKNNYSENAIDFNGKLANIKLHSATVIESVDTNSDGIANFYELLQEQLTQSYQVKNGLSRNEAQEKASKIIKEYADDSTKIQSIANNINDQSQEAQAIREILTMINSYDIDSDLGINYDEATRAQYATAQYETSDGKIDISDYYSFTNDTFEGVDSVNTYLSGAGDALGLSNFNLEAEFKDFNYKATNKNSGTITISGNELPIEHRDGKFYIKFDDEELDFNNIQELKISVAELAEYFN